jgi:ATP-dependent helicase HrpB
MTQVRSRAALPVDEVADALRAALSSARSAVLQAPPGSGKTTRVPLLLLKESWLAGKRILMLEPRRLAARAAARFMAKSLGEDTGETVGYHVRMDRVVGPDTRIEVVTEGILTRYLQSDPSIERAGLVIFDEFHERSLHADLGLALCLESRSIFRADLRILVMSATLDAEPVARMLGGAPVVTAGGKSFPVETRYREGPPPADFVQEAAKAAARAVSEERGSILVFLPGKKEIRRAESLLREMVPEGSAGIFPLYGELPGEVQDAAIRPPSPGERKIVLSTSIAETSLTIEGIRVVVDSGWMRVSRFDPANGMSRLHTVRVSRASADQRRGRAGRLEEGVCIRLWDSSTHRGLIDFSRPEILDADLAGLVLELAFWGVSEPETLSWLDPPPKAAFSQAKQLLVGLGAIDCKGRITAHGGKMAGFGLHPRLSHMILKGASLGMGRIACELAALLGERDILRDRAAKDADLISRLELLRNVGRGAALADMGIDRGACRRVEKTARQFQQEMNVLEGGGQEGDPKRAGLLLAFAYPDRIGRRRPGAVGRYFLSGGRGAFLPESDPLSLHPFLVAARLDAGEIEARIFLAAPVQADDLEEHFTDRIESRSEIFWDDRARGVSIRKRRFLGALILKDDPLAGPDPEQVGRALAEGIRKKGLHVLPWTAELRNWQKRVQLMRRSERNGSWPDVADAALAEHLEVWLLPFLSGMTRLDHLRSLDLKSALFSLLPPDCLRNLDRLAPTHLEVPSGSRIRLDYLKGEVPVLSVRLQEMFGQRETPKIAGGRIPVMIYLLSPAMRPVQVTQDLESFWRNTYAEVRKDLRGRYPKHFWPEDPLEAPPTRG